LILMGELHGTDQAPAAFGNAVCRALEQGRTVSAGLEFDREQAEPLAAYLASSGGKDAVAALLQSAFWARASQDGRSSRAMLALVERLRQLQRRYPGLAVFALEDDAGIAPLDAGTTRDQHMAARVRTEHARRPQALILTLSGNIHNRLKPLDGVPALPMGSYLLDLAPRSVQLATLGGSSWACAPDCGVHDWPALPTQAAGAPVFRELAAGGAHTGEWSLGPATASLPAAQDWRPAWAAVPDSAGPRLTAGTIRQIVRPSIGGSTLRLRLSNLYGKAPLTIDSVHLALPGGAARIQAATDHSVTFAGKAAVTIAPGADATSDPVGMALPALADLAVSFHLPADVAAPTLHGSGMQTAYIAPGDLAAAPDMPAAKTDDSRYFLTDVEVLADRRTDTLVVLGDSITDGIGSGNDNNARWPDLLAARLQTATARAPVAVVNAGIAGNRLLLDATAPFVGPSARSRFERDALDKPGVRWILLHEGINDIATATLLHQPQSQVRAAQVIEGLTQLAARAHAQGVKVGVGTLLPFEGTEQFYSKAAEAERQAVNAWIRSSGAFDAVADFDLAMRDPAHPSRLRAELDSGDHLHPNQAGYRAMAETIDVRMFQMP
jgi:lysophospholipase L1-like esterase